MKSTLIAALLFALPALAEAPKVVTDIAITQSLVAQVMGDAGTPALLIDQGGDPHDFQLRPSQARALAKADLVFWIGPALTPWLDRALQAIPADARTVPLLQADGTQQLHYADPGHEDDHDHGPVDPHAWLDPANAQAWLAAIAAELTRADPANATTYAANAQAAQQALTALDAGLRATLAPAQTMPLFTGHDAYGHLARAYDLTQGGALADGDAAPPGAAHLAQLRDTLASSGAPCLFTDPGQNPGLAANLTEGTTIRTVTLDPTGTTLPQGPEHYARTMRALAQAIAGCVAGR